MICWCYERAQAHSQRNDKQSLQVISLPDIVTTLFAYPLHLNLLSFVERGLPIRLTLSTFRKAPPFSGKDLFKSAQHSLARSSPTPSPLEYHPHPQAALRALLSCPYPSSPWPILTANAKDLLSISRRIRTAL